MLSPPSITAGEAQKLFWQQHVYRKNFNRQLKKGQFIFGPYDEEDTSEFFKLKSPYFFKPYVAVGKHFLVFFSLLRCFFYYGIFL